MTIVCYVTYVNYVNNKITIKFGFRVTSRIIKAASADNANLCLDNFRHHAQPHPIIIKYGQHMLLVEMMYYWHRYILPLTEAL